MQTIIEDIDEENRQTTMQGGWVMSEDNDMRNDKID